MKSFEIISYAASALAILLGLSAVVRRKITLAQWAFLAGMVLLAVETFTNTLSFRSPLPREILSWQLKPVIIGSLLSAVWLLFSLVYARGNYRQFLSKWLFLLVAIFLVPLACLIFYPDQLLDKPVTGDLVRQWYIPLKWAGKVLFFVHLLSIVLILMNLERTFRATVGTMRWRTKYMMLGLGLLFAVRFYTTSQTLLFSAINSYLLGVNAVALLLGGILVIRSLLREGLFSTDVYPSQSLLQYSLTGFLAGVYLLIVGVLAKLVSVFGGDLAFPLKAFFVMVSLVLLAVFLLSERIRQYIKRFVSRHLHRPSHDYRQIWNTFTRSTSSITDRENLCRTMVKLVSDTFHVLSVTIWLTDDTVRRLKLSASTSPGKDQNPATVDWTVETQQLEAVLGGKVHPISMADTTDARVKELARLNPDVQEHCRNHVLVPVFSGTQLLGLMAVGDRVNRVPFSLEDLELLACLGDHIAANLLNIQLSEKIVEGRELEAFQVMSAFFVHDLKNTASTLSLMLKNLPDHFDDPDFRKDALRGLGKSVDRINELIGRLGLLRQETDIHLKKNDLNQVVEAAVSRVGHLDKVDFSKDLEPMPEVMVDADRLQKVLINFLVNAVEAVGDGGQVRLETALQPPWAVIRVMDHGCGMSPDFVANSLFRPFQTTKNKGIGIGMFLSKKILDAHGGSVDVESELGKGTTFQILLPLLEKET